MNGGGLFANTIGAIFPIAGALESFVNSVNTNKLDNSIETYQNTSPENTLPENTSIKDTSTEDSSTEDSSTEDSSIEDSSTEDSSIEDEDLYNDVMEDTVEGGWDSMLDF